MKQFIYVSHTGSFEHGISMYLGIICNVDFYCAIHRIYFVYNFFFYFYLYLLRWGLLLDESACRFFFHWEAKKILTTSPSSAAWLVAKNRGGGCKFGALQIPRRGGGYLQTPSGRASGQWDSEIEALSLVAFKKCTFYL